MILSFNSRFKKPILKGTKIHTIRKDSNNRWVAGRMIHFATGVRTSRYNCFKNGECRGVQKIQIKWYSDSDYEVFVDGVALTYYSVELLATNDGFDSIAEFLKWFNADFYGKIIHFTDFKYDTKLS